MKTQNTITHAPSIQILALADSFPCLRSKFASGYPLVNDPHEGRRFDPDRLMEQIGPWSSGEQLCAIFVVNVWNPSYAKSKGWAFDLFQFIGTADRGNVQPVLDWMDSPIWP